MNLPLIYLIFIPLTIITVLLIGYYASKSVTTSTAYSVNGRNSTEIMIAGSLLGTSIGGGATVGTAQMAFSFGISAFWFTLGTGIAFIIMGLFYAKKLRETPMETVPQFLSSIYGEKIETPATIINSIGILLSAVASSLPGIHFIAFFFHISFINAALLLMIFVILYTFFGGMKTAAIGGLAKTFIIYTTLFIAGYIAFLSLSEPAAYLSFPSSYFSLAPKGACSVFTDLLALITGVICTQTYVQCIFSAKSPTFAMWGCFIAALIIIPVGLPSVAIGMYMHLYYPEAISTLVLPLFLLHEVPPILGAIAIGSILLALIGSIGGLSLGVGTMISHDLLTPILHIKKDKILLWITKASVVAVMVLASFIAILYHDSQILFWNYTSLALRGAGFLIPFTAALFYPSLFHKKSVLFSLWSGSLAGLATLFLQREINPFFITLSVSVIILLLGLFLKK